MKGSVQKRCTCAVEYNDRGQRIACKKPHGSWFFTADAGRDATGKRRQVKRGGFATKAAAEEALAEFVDQTTKGMTAHDGQQRAAEFLRDWIDSKERNGLRISTARGYRRHIETIFIPAFGYTRLRDLRGGHIEQALAQYATSSTHPSAASIHRAHATIRSALATAKRQRRISFNPALDMELPKASRPKVQPWEPHELGAFLDHAAGDPWGEFFEVVAATGLRRGEALGLRWADIDFNLQRLTVRQQIQSHHPGVQCPTCRHIHPGLTFERPKTDAGTDRLVDLDSRTIGVLLAHKLVQDGQREKWATGYDDHDLVFCNEDGTPLHPERASHHFVRLISEVRFDDDKQLPDDQRRRLRRIRLHDLRHGQASLMMAAGVPIAVVSKRLGHSSIQITSDTYSHLLDGVGRNAAEAAAALIPRSTEQTPVTNS